jgi:hypothetical protein
VETPGLTRAAIQLDDNLLEVTIVAEFMRYGLIARLVVETRQGGLFGVHEAGVGADHGKQGDT